MIATEAHRWLISDCNGLDTSLFEGGPSTSWMAEGPHRRVQNRVGDVCAMHGLLFVQLTGKVQNCAAAEGDVAAHAVAWTGTI